jgi:hypothetical protein
VGGHQHTPLLGHTILLGMGVAVRAGLVRHRTAHTDMVPHAARRLPVWTLTAAPRLLSPTGRLTTPLERRVGHCCPFGKQVVPDTGLDSFTPSSQQTSLSAKNPVGFLECTEIRKQWFSIQARRGHAGLQ